ncbi:MAG: serine/threonine-protein kinase [Myxococcota bacterium]|nr:serine/threonine-protein kinase [Myxococcota bacterium]
MTSLGRYTVISRLAVGGMAEVFAATMAGAEGFVKPVVVKRLLPHLCAKPEIVRLFLNEARLAAQFSHPNLAQVYELFEAGGSYCIAMEQLDGIDLYELQRRLPAPRLPARAVGEIIAGVAAGLHVAHSTRDASGKPVGIIHRDVSPTNVVVTRSGVVKLVDFGVAKLLDSQAPTQRRGKPRYMSPEQISGTTLDGRSDLFALGAVAYELLTASPCFDGETVMDVAHAINNAAFTRIGAIAPGVDAQLAGLVERMLAPERDVRPANADDVRREAREIVSRLGGPGYALLDDIDVAIFGFDGEITHKTAMTARFLVTEATEIAAPPVTEDLIPLQSREQPVARSNPRFSPRLMAISVIGAVVALATGMIWQHAPRDVRAETAPPAAVARAEAPSVAIADMPDASPPPVTTPLVPEPQRRPVKARVRPLQRTAPPREEPARGSGSLIVNSEPWSDVYLDGVRVGITPLALHDVTAGPHDLQLRNDAADFRVRRDVHVRAGETTKAFERAAPDR